MKLVLFIGELSEEATQLRKDMMAKGYSCPHVFLPDEIDQAGKQSNKAVLIFSGTKLPSSYISEAAWPFPVLKILFLKAKPKLSEEVKEKINQINIELYYPAILNDMLGVIDKFLHNDTLAEAENIINNLEFTVHDQIKGSDYDK